MGRRRRQERREERQDDRQLGTRRGGGKRYKMRQKLVSIGNDFWIEDDQGHKAFKVDGKALRVRNTVKFEDAHGNELCKIQERMLRVKDSITPVRDRWTVKIGNGPDLDVQGNILDHEYHIGEGRDKVAEVSKKWFRIRDTYGVAIDPGQNDALILAITVCIDQMAH
jgi:uncharacterized protein YxjI